MGIDDEDVDVTGTNHIHPVTLLFQLKVNHLL